MFTVTFWKDAAERAIKTFFQAIIPVLAIGVPVWAMNWTEALGLAASASALSLITSVASQPVGVKGTPSAVVASPVPTENATTTNG